MTTPPYDVISNDERRHYLDASPYSVIRLVLGPDDAGDGGAGDKYRRAASELETWRSERCARPDRARVVLPVRDAVLAARAAARDPRTESARSSSRTGAARSCRTNGRCPGPIEDRTPADAGGPDRTCRASTRCSGARAKPFAVVPGRRDDARARGHHVRRGRRRAHALGDETEPEVASVARARVPDDRRRAPPVLDGPALPGRRCAPSTGRVHGTAS